MKKNRLTRRQFVRTMSVGAGGVLLGKAVLAAPSPEQQASSEAFRLVGIGKTGIKTTFLGMGTGFSGYNRSSNITRAGTAESVIRTAWEKGIRFFDCADSYGTHPFTAKALKGIPREKYVLGSKIWLSEGGIPEPERPNANIVVDRFRKELNTDYIDLLQIHCMTDSKWTDMHRKQMDIIENLKVKNIIKAHGVSVHSLEAMQACVASPWVDVVHVRINPFGESMDNKNPDVVVPVIKKLHESGKGIIGMKLIGNGKYRNDPGKMDEALRFVLGLNAVDMIIVGFEKPEQIDDYIARIDRVKKI
ncbi:MAG TPA: aldo/keto reductase [Bacteroidales bacterium]|jgi:predicted aldo/keto reductase-like oxidoreductase|nr:aldo/keto reductase [Bacteroidales bacterium]